MTLRHERIEIAGVLQRVGFGSFLARLADELGVRGNVGAVGGVGGEAALMFVHLGANEEVMPVFLERTVREAPALAHLEQVRRRASDDRHRLAAGPGEHDARRVRDVSRMRPGVRRPRKPAVSSRTPQLS